MSKREWDANARFFRGPKFGPRLGRYMGEIWPGAGRDIVSSCPSLHTPPVPRGLIVSLMVLLRIYLAAAKKKKKKGYLSRFGYTDMSPMDDAKFYAIALEEARKGFDEGGIPVRATYVPRATQVICVHQRRYTSP